MNNVQAPVAHSVDEIYRLQAVIGKYWTYFRASVEIMPSLTHMVACWTPLPCKFPCRLRLHWCEKGPYFRDRVPIGIFLTLWSLLGPYSYFRVPIFSVLAKFARKMSTQSSCAQYLIYRVTFLTGPALKVLSVGYGKIPTKKVKVRLCHREYVKF